MRSGIRQRGQAKKSRTVQTEKTERIYSEFRSKQHRAANESAQNPCGSVGASDAYNELRQSMLSTLAHDVINTPRLADRRKAISAAGVHLGDEFEQDLKRLITELWRAAHR